MSHPSLLVHRHQPSSANHGTRGVALPRSHFAVTHIGAVFVQALIGLRHAPTSLPKTVGTVRNVAVVPQALRGQGLKPRLVAVDLPSWLPRRLGDVAFLLRYTLRRSLTVYFRSFRICLVYSILRSEFRSVLVLRVAFMDLA